MRLPTHPDLEGASVYITGGGAGIGAALTDAFLGQGAKVAFVQRSDATAFCDRMEEKHGGNRPLFMTCDVTDTDRLRATMEEAASAHGDVTRLICNAANDQRHDTLEVTGSFWDWMMEINLKSYFFTAQAALPGMKRAGGGSIVNFSSVSYMMGNAGYPAYATANGGITALTRSLAREFGPDNIRVNAIAPGWVLTEKQREKWATEASLADQLGKQCLKTHLEEDDIAGPVLFLASEASRMMTSQCIAVDGGVVTVAA
ncbi:SDR family NAD(P)-dependent oxidoreductase [Cognatishimia sp. F0-27]|uniref:SDR family NAD(P)-dependent oxidoreductase n=1 Tax=Cognatishimia sp. F0-27 TaxID=2816855 RepID=UPI001D0C3168|nr:SDR family oxidoreductase [Cognatishimia sp. F0-27]MCC1494848.1 SDR family oxidoreductase [Cognatishimia sp. F0-27]